MQTSHNPSRRNFLKTSAITLAGATLAPEQLLALGKRKGIMGIQLYSVRDDMKNAPLATLQELAKFGYRYVEHANYVDRKFYGYTPTEFKKLLRDQGMKMLSGHTKLDTKHWDESKKDFTDAWKWTVEDAAIVGQKFVVSPWINEEYRKTYDDLLRYMEVFNKCGELCQKSGMKFGYHNHHFEFKDKLNDISVYDIILQNTDPKLVVQQLDTGNLFNGGVTALDIVKKYPGRFELMHVKDETLSNGGHDQYESTILGTGIAQVKEVLDLCRKLGNTHNFIVEQEAYQGKSPMECAREDFKVMKGWGY